MNDDTNVQNNAPDTQQQDLDLTLNDLNAMKMIIDVASQRGAFKPNEMVVVGQTYTKLTNFLESVAKQQASKGTENGQS